MNKRAACCLRGPTPARYGLLEDAGRPISWSGLAVLVVWQMAPCREEEDEAATKTPAAHKKNVTFCLQFRPVGPTPKNSQMGRAWRDSSAAPSIQPARGQISAVPFGGQARPARTQRDQEQREAKAGKITTELLDESAAHPTTQARNTMAERMAGVARRLACTGRVRSAQAPCQHQDCLVRKLPLKAGRPATTTQAKHTQSAPLLAPADILVAPAMRPHPTSAHGPTEAHDVPRNALSRLCLVFVRKETANSAGFIPWPSWATVKRWQAVHVP
jgi:hypothetical protein